jgi:hypothetical protein
LDDDQIHARARLSDFPDKARRAGLGPPDPKVGWILLIGVVVLAVVCWVRLQNLNW